MSGHLRLVHPAPPKEPKKRAPRRAPVFTLEEQAVLRAVLQTARGLFGTWECLADAMHMRKLCLWRAVSGTREVSAEIAVRLSRALGVPLTALITPGLRLVRFPKVCPTCGRGGP